MSTIAVLGATGRTGRMIVNEALARGHRVTAVVRRAGSLGPAAGLTVVTADPTRPGALNGLLDEHDVVISALGAAGRGPTTLYSDSAATIMTALRPRGRLLVLSSAGVGIPSDADLVSRLFARLLHRIMREVYTDMERMERQLAHSELTWTAVRPTRLTHDPAARHPRISVGAKAKVGPRTSRADLARYLLDAIDDPRTYRTPVAISS
ncbi:MULTISPECIES: NAD(P)-dependent oxidoreductase [Nocardia]|uniref:NAD(P)-dependent oxidoreductase n=1 Tax=Nocardia TaxID=1817 RepID=UPI0002F5719A|nr:MULTISPECIES: NAD(P)H-binding protein [Nocardia]